MIRTSRRKRLLTVSSAVLIGPPVRERSTVFTATSKFGESAGSSRSSARWTSPMPPRSITPVIRNRPPTNSRAMAAMAPLSHACKTDITCAGDCTPKR